jgi:hypothetical protein
MTKATRYEAKIVNTATGAAKVMFGDKVIRHYSNITAARTVADNLNFLADLATRRAARNSH